MPLFDELKRRNVIRVAAFYLVASWFALQVGDILFDAFEFPAWSMRLLVVILAIGLVPALALSWVYEWTPDGLKREVDVAVNSARRGTGRKMNVAISILFAGAAGMVAIDRLTPLDVLQVERSSAPASARPATSVAVMPFLNISPSETDAYFADGLAEELLNILAGIPQLEVSARTSSFALRDQNLDVRTVGERLNVASVLEGSVRKAGEDLRIAVQLVNTDTGYERWSATFDRKLDDIFEVQNQIAVETARALAISLLGDTLTVRRTSPETYALYLQGLFAYRSASPSGYQEAIATMQEVLADDPLYVPALTVMSSSYSNLALSGGMTFEEGSRLAKAAAIRALEIEPDHAHANSARAWIAMTREADYIAAAEYFKRAIRYSPGDPIILGNAAVLARTLGRVEMAIELTRESIARNPLSPVGYTNLADQLSRVGRLDEAVVAAQRASELAPQSLIARANLGLGYVMINDHGKAAQIASRFDAGSFYQVYLEALACRDSSRAGPAADALTQIESKYADSRAFYIATVYAWCDDRESAFTWLDRAVESGQRTLGIRTEPLLESLQEDPRWEALLFRLGLADSQVQNIEFQL